MQALDDWMLAEHRFLPVLVRSIVESALSTAVSRDPWARIEGSGVWNRSRAPHCYGFEYEQEFGRPFCMNSLSELHNAVWRRSKWWPNVPPVSCFYPEYGTFNCTIVEHMLLRAKAARRRELKAQRERRKAYDISYNEVRRKRRRERRLFRKNNLIVRAVKHLYH